LLRRERMRLGQRSTDIIGSVVAKAMSGECVVRVDAPSRVVARRMFDGVTRYIEERGGSPAPRNLAWHLPNGSEIRIEVAA
jgi:hypothetical protein